MGVTGRRSSGPGPAGEPHAHLTLAITPAPTAHHYQHVQGGFIQSEPAHHRPQDEEALQAGLTRRKRADQPADQEAAASSHEEDVDEDVAEDDAEAAASGGAGDDGDMFLEPDAAGGHAGAVPTGEPAATTDATGAPQNLFPAFQPLFPLGHSRPPIFQVSEEPAFSQRQALLRPQQYNPYNPYVEAREPRLELAAQHAAQHGFRERAYPQPAAPIAAPAELHSNALLGSGNFGVIHGGTFYGEEKESQVSEDYDSPSAALHSFYGGNGHGRPAFYRGNPEPQRYRTSEDFFANFRDFADISTPTKSSFSEYYVVYVNRNASRADPGTMVGPDGQAVVAAAPQHLPVSSGSGSTGNRPNNIFERLAQIDREHAAVATHSTAAADEAVVPKKKLSLGKRKLALLDKKKGGKKALATREVEPEAQPETQHEPLLALS
ncbi:uncharacterized protein LOC113207815 isoform X1 [Frankliniella occidentalis]|uniref:Uncharacterized protein LOC113207815 isoform X1 n=1 Tax=Frankliniella occidentalis TaxID=133901 RepID=A0A9C6UDM3_FRAOC|nr:uncharacterized protein LOC113207815 isoform X1 [Frankliniella occidentalis]